MRLTFLGSRLPLTKTIAAHEGVYTVAPYPHVTKLTSYHEEAATLQEMHQLLQAHAVAAHCLLAGSLQQPLVQESRAGKTLKGAPREWVVFDFDKIDVPDAETAIRTCLPACCHNVSYIEQRSSSMFRPGEHKWSGHLFMLLAQPSNAVQLQTWFESINFSIPALESQLTLTDSGVSLHWPLDRTVALDSKLIYIAPPRCHGFVPALRSPDAIHLVRKRKASVVIPSFTPVDSAKLHEKVNALRTAAGLPTRTLDSRRFEDGELLLKSEPGVISDVRASGDHYIQFNLNGGDSLGYWIDLRNPSIIKNFKGEPWLLTREVDERFFKKLSGAAPRAMAGAGLDEGGEVLAFFATNDSATVTTGLWSPLDRNLRLDQSNLTAAAAWLATYGVVQGGMLPHYDLVFDPQTDLQYVRGHPVINTFRRTDYMVQTPSSSKPSSIAELPPVIGKTIRSLLGSPDETVLAGYLNWLACIFQRRCKTGVAWVHSGVEGTGKTKFVQCVLTPIFGSQVVRSSTFTVAQTQFNAYLDGALLVVFEEATLSAVENNAELMAKLKHWITDDVVEIHAKGCDPVDKKTFCNFMFNSNERNPVSASESNRRFNFSNRQEQPLIYTPNEYVTLMRGDELESFADLLHRWVIDEAMLRHIISTDAAKLVHEQTTSINALIAEAIRQGDVQFFVDRAPSLAEAAGDFHNKFNPIGLYNDLLDSILTGKHEVLTYEDMYVLFRTLIPDSRYFQDSKTWRMRHFNALGLKCKRIRVGKDERVYGIKVDWRISAELRRLHSKGDESAPNVVGIKAKPRKTA